MEIKLNLKSSNTTNVELLSKLSANALAMLAILNNNDTKDNITLTVNIPIKSNNGVPTVKSTKESLIELSRLGLVKLN